ncbi:MAG: hypothetical protein EX272_02915 [Chromatiales bacterium]|nr:MAG: hypothetical protein EX272_02915 [Chromatiales bacterium]
MNDKRVFFLVAATAIGLAACGQGQQVSPEPAKTEPVADEKAQFSSDAGHTPIPAKAGAPFSISYKIIGTPIVGSPVSLDLQIFSAFGAAPVDISYQVVDETALELPDAQPRAMTLAPAESETFIEDRVTVVPLREGRVYINVSAAVETEGGSSSAIISVPLHVGDVDTGLVEHGELQVDEEGETTRVLTSD